MTTACFDIDAFIASAGWGGAQIENLPADFSSRRFMRLQRGAGMPLLAILMEADADQKTPQFVALAELLRGMGISAPEIYAAKPEAGLVLMEDFGDANFGRMLDKGARAEPFYLRAAEVLVQLHKNFTPEMTAKLDLPVFNAALFAKQAEFAVDYYLPFRLGRQPSVEDRETFAAAWSRALQPVDGWPQSLMLRDYMLDNLMQLDGDEDWRATGVLDFQDAGLGPLPYDIASLCECVRRDQRADWLEKMIAFYHARHPIMPIDALRSACHILSAQRHTRILGIVARRAEKQQMLPRIENYLKNLLQDEALLPVRQWFEERRLLV